jgi:hypothetical protein
MRGPLSLAPVFFPLCSAIEQPIARRTTATRQLRGRSDRQYSERVR